MADFVTCDFETQSACDIKKCGAEKYAECDTTAVLCLGYKFPGRSSQLWIPGQPIPVELIEHVAAGRVVVAHNSIFEYGIWNLVLRNGRYGQWPELTFEQLHDTMPRARALSLPGGLDDCCAALRLPIRKDQDGYRAMMKVCRPRTRDPLVFHTPETAPEDFAKLYAYCPIDVEAGEQLYNVLPPLTAKEHELWILDQKINWRGVPLDTPNVNRAIDLIAEQKSELSARVLRLTGGASTATQRDALLDWFAMQGLYLPTLTKAEVSRASKDEALEGTLVKEVLSARAEAAKGSNAKLSAMRAGAGKNGRARGLLSYHGATTGRWAGRRIQTQNMPRPAKGFKPEDAEWVIGLLKHRGAARAIRFEYGSVMDAVSWSLRQFIKAAPGHRLIAADYSNIEGRVLAWLAGEDWKIDAFRLYDQILPGFDAKGEPNRAGPDLYKLAASKSLGMTLDEVDDFFRQIGKVMELALGYSGGIGSFISMGANYGVVPEDISRTIKAATPEDVWNATMKRLPKLGTRFRAGLEPDVWCGLRIVVDSWRAAHPRVVQFWKALEQAAIDAVESPGIVTSAGGAIRYRMEGDFLKCKLPSGRCITYPYAEMKRFPSMDWEARRDELKFAIKEAGVPADQEAVARLEAELKEHEANVKWVKSLTYWGVSSKAGSSKKWKQQRAYGGLLSENCLAGGTLVLSRRGWIRLDSVTGFDQLWDGVAFAFHGGLIRKGVANTLSVDGVRMTPEHLVHTVEGWRSASSCEGHHRQDVRLPYGRGVPRIGRAKIALAHALRMWWHEGSSRNRTSEGSCKILRLQTSRINQRRASFARHVTSPGVLGLAFDERSMSLAYASGLAQLRRARDYCLRGVGALFRSVLARHGADVSGRAYTRAERQQRPVLQGQLSLGDVQSASQEQTNQLLHANAVGQAHDSGSFGAFGNWRHNDPIPDCEPMAGKPFAVTSGREESIFDILNCGPLNRFVVLGGSGPFIVHNCTQATARVCLAEAIPRLEAAGYPVVMHVHDEIVCEIPRDYGDLNEFSHKMCEGSEWTTGLPVVAAGWIGQRYRKG